MKKILTSLLLATSAASWAQQDKTWVMADADDSSVAIPIESIGYLIAADNDACFSAVCTDGTVHHNIRTATFRQADLSAIRPAGADTEGPTVRISAQETLTVTGCHEGADILLCTAAGKALAHTHAQAGKALLQVASLPTGVYILRVGKTAIKFNKK